MQQSDYVGWNGGAIGPKGHDESVLAGYEIVDDPLGAANAAPTTDEDGDVCLHTDVEPYEDEPSRGACVDCGEEFAFRKVPSGNGEPVEASAEEEAPVDIAALDDAVAVA